MKDKDLIIFTLMASIFTIPFLITVIINPDGFSKHQTWPLIILGMATASLPMSIFGVSKIMILGNELQNNREDKQ